jgi:hypothetical protein
MPNDLGRDSKRGLEVFFEDLVWPGALATFLVGAYNERERTRTESVTRARRETM